ncbi:MAG TPA: TatD family hydrolase [Chlamydiales bacterium]|nr:TatD family hydrolase [Chlamydiales bacterium]
MTHYYDSHAHLSSPEVYSQIEAILTRAKIAHVRKVLNICTDPDNLKLGLQLRSDGVQNAGATTPHDVEKEGESAFPLFAHAARTKQLVAVGETGLDYHYEHSNKETQKKFLKRYLHLALECALPVIFHCRDAFEDLFAITDKEYQKKAPAILHCFTGTMEEAKEVIQRGWYLSLSGIVTFKKSEGLREVAKIVPLSQLLIETDTPYLAPQSKRGKQNEPAFLPEIAACIAAARGIGVEEVAQATFENASHLFNRP